MDIVGAKRNEVCALLHGWCVSHQRGVGGVGGGGSGSVCRRPGELTRGHAYHDLTAGPGGLHVARHRIWSTGSRYKGIRGSEVRFFSQFLDAAIYLNDIYI